MGHGEYIRCQGGDITVLCIPLFQHSIIPRGSLSLKVLAELPIIVVLMYQVCVFFSSFGFKASHFTTLSTPAFLWRIDVCVTTCTRAMNLTVSLLCKLVSYSGVKKHENLMCLL